MYQCKQSIFYESQRLWKIFCLIRYLYDPSVLKIVEECDHVHFCFAHHRAHKQEVYPSAREWWKILEKPKIRRTKCEDDELWILNEKNWRQRRRPHGMMSKIGTAISVGCSNNSNTTALRPVTYCTIETKSHKIISNSYSWPENLELFHHILSPLWTEYSIWYYFTIELETVGLVFSCLRAVFFKGRQHICSYHTNISNLI